MLHLNKLSFSLFLLFFSTGIFAQNNLSPILAEVISGSLKSIPDSISFYRNLSNTCRADMDTYFKNLGYGDKDRPFIYGPNDDWYKEGMHKFFKKTPQSAGFHIERNPNEPKLENRHIDLYLADIALFHFMHKQAIFTRFQNLAVTDSLAAVITKKLDVTVPGWRNKTIGEDKMRTWLTAQADCEALREMEKRFGKKYLLKRKPAHQFGSWKKTMAPKKLELTPGLKVFKVAGSYPAAGQYNFYPQENMEEVGYFSLTPMRTI